MTDSKRDRAIAEGYSGRRAAEVVGITYRQLDYWARTDLVRPSLAEANGSGSRRQYSYRDLLELKVIKSLLDAGIRLESVRSAFSYLREHLGEDVTTANLVIRGSAVLVSTDEDLVDVMKQGQGVLNILPLGGVKDEVDAAIVQLRPATPSPEETTDHPKRMCRPDGQSANPDPVTTDLANYRGSGVDDPLLRAAATQFVHNSERQMALLLDFYGVEWEYEPHTFVLSRGDDGRVLEAFSPDFFLPAHRRYLEITTQRQSLVTRKNRKVRRLREQRPDLDIQIVYQRDYLHLLARYGLESPSQLHATSDGTRAAEATGLLALGPVGPSHPSSPTFRRAG